MFHPQGPSFFELALQALSSTRRGYDLLAPKFDYTPYRTRDEVIERVVERLAPEARVLDLCCGTGAGMKALKNHCREAVGLDFSEGMLEVGQRLAPDWSGEGRLEWQQGDALALEYHQEFEGVVCFGAFGHILPHQEPAFVRGIFQALKSGGRFVFVTAAPPAVTSIRLWRSLLFNAAMVVRNTLIRPPFVMYYLTFLLPRARPLLMEAGFQVRVEEGLFEDPALLLVTATKS